MALISVEVEYMATSTTMCEAIWVQKLLVSWFRQRMEAINVYCNNQSCIKLSENPLFHDRLKHTHTHIYIYDVISLEIVYSVGWSSYNMFPHKSRL